MLAATIAGEAPASAIIRDLLKSDELVALLAKPDSELTGADLYRTSQLARLPEQLRPSLPPAIDGHFRFENLGLLRYHPHDNRAAATVFDQARVHMAAVVDPEGALRAVRARLDAGQPIDIRIVTALKQEPELLAKYGITEQVLEQQAVRALAHAGTGGHAEQQQYRCQGSLYCGHRSPYDQATASAAADEVPSGAPVPAGLLPGVGSIAHMGSSRFLSHR